MKKIYCLLMMAFFVVNVFAQNVGIGTNTPNASALLELQSANKGLLLPRVADTNAVTTPAKGLLIFSNASNSTWFYDGTKWQGATTDGLWTTFQDSIAISQKKHVGINTDYKLYPAKKGIQANGSLLIHQEMTSTNAAPTVAQTHTMDNLPTVYAVEDSILRVLDPGGSNVPYFNNSQGNASLYTNTGVGFEISFNGSDFGIATGDTLWISTTTFPNCRTNYIRRYLNTTLVPENFNVNNNQVFVVFRSNGDNINNKGFDITCKTIYKKSSTESSITSIGNALYFNGNIGSLGVGSNVTASGINSFAMGSNSKANGYGSIAMGNDANASGYIAISLGDRTISSGQTSTSIGFQTKALDFASMAFGASTTASGSTSTAMGLASTASGVASTAMGYNTNAIGDNSTAMGNSTTASGAASIAMGASTSANGAASTAMGQLTSAIGEYSTAMGQSTTASGANSTVMGVASTASGIGSTAMGSFTTASSSYSTAMGNNTTSSGNASTSMGLNTTASGFYSTAMGNGTTASGATSTAIGSNTIASGGRAIAMGATTIASGDNSTTMGIGTAARGLESTALGSFTNARAMSSLAIGSFNDSIASSNPTTWVNTDPLLYIGNSQNGASRSNAMVVYKNANVDINGFTRLGKASEGAPTIKMKEYTGTTSSVNNGSQSISLSGIDASKVLSVNVFVGIAGNAVWIPPAYDNDPRLKYNYFVHTDGNIYIQNSSSNCTLAGDHICNKTVKITITYKE